MVSNVKHCSSQTRTDPPTKPPTVELKREPASGNGGGSGAQFPTPKSMVSLPMRFWIPGLTKRTSVTIVIQDKLVELMGIYIYRTGGAPSASIQLKAIT